MQLKEKAVAVAQTVTTPGWSIIKEIFNHVLREAKDEVIELEDSQKAEQMRLGLKVAMNVLSKTFGIIESTASYDEESEEALSSLSFDAMLEEKQKELDSARTDA